jgi:hypothetical protein
MPCKVEGALKWYCDDCGDDVSLTIEHDKHADIGGFTLDGVHIHFGGEIIKLPELYIGINNMNDFRAFAEVMRAVRENVQDHE